MGLNILNTFMFFDAAYYISSRPCTFSSGARFKWEQVLMTGLPKPKLNKTKNPPYRVYYCSNQIGSNDMKCLKTICIDISLYAVNWSDEQGTSYGHCNGFLSHKIEISRKKNISCTSLEKSKTTHAAEKSNLIILWSE